MTTSHPQYLPPNTGLGPIEPTSPTTVRDLRLTPHARYYFSSGDIVVVVDRMRYRIHACLLAPHSETFSQLIQSDESSTTATSEAYITLRRTSTAEFEAFLSLVYPTELGVLPNPDENGWRNILSFASTCGFTSLITTALAGLDAYFQPIEKVLLGDRLGIPALTRQGVREVCIRTAPPTFNEGRQLGLDNVMSVAILREKTQCYRPNRATALTEGLLDEILAQRDTHVAPVSPANGSTRGGAGGAIALGRRAAGVAVNGTAIATTTNATSTGDAGIPAAAGASTRVDNKATNGAGRTGAAGGTSRAGQSSS